jgi:YggT family protein
MLSQIGQLLVDVVAGLFVCLLLVRFHFQWLRVPFRNPPGVFVVAATNWIVLPARRVVPALAGFDIATLVAAWLLQALALWALYALKGVDFGAAAGSAAALLAAWSLLDLARYSLYILIFAVLVQVVLSWVNPYSPVAPIFEAMTRPFLKPVRRIVPPIANVDLSPLVLLVALQVLLIALAHLRERVGANF